MVSHAPPDHTPADRVGDYRQIQEALQRRRIRDAGSPKCVRLGRMKWLCTRSSPTWACSSRRVVCAHRRRQPLPSLATRIRSSHALATTADVVFLGQHRLFLGSAVCTVATVDLVMSLPVRASRPHARRVVALSRRCSRPSTPPTIDTSTRSGTRSFSASKNSNTHRAYGPRSAGLAKETAAFFSRFRSMRSVRFALRRRRNSSHPRVVKVEYRQRCKSWWSLQMATS
jgi:hypothetical protein